MGLALDEPHDEDKSYTVEDVPVIVDPFALKIITEAGGIKIKQSIFGPTAELTRAASGECSC